MSYSIEEAKLSDASAIAQVHICSWKVSYAGIVSAEWLDRQTIEERTHNWRRNLSGQKDGAQTVYVCRDSRRLVAFATVGPSRSETFSDFAELWAIYVHPDYFSKGTGRLLLNCCIDHARSEGFSKMFVNVLRDNQRGRKFYEKTGAVLIPNSAGRVTLGEQEYDDVKYAWEKLER
jgi:GNAT superfamily N-acetyltransferase